MNFLIKVSLTVNCQEYQDIYNPWSILNFLAKGKYATYWANTSSNGLIGNIECQAPLFGIVEPHAILSAGENTAAAKQGVEPQIRLFCRVQTVALSAVES